MVIKKSGKRDSDPRPQPWQGCALPTELFPLVFLRKPICILGCARIPPSLKGISLDCGCKGNAFFGIDKLFSSFFNKKIAIILFRPLEKAVTPYYILFLK